MEKQHPYNETVEPVFPNDHKIIKQTKDDGSVVFHHPVGSEVEVYRENLETLFTLEMERFKSLSEMLSDRDEERFGFLFNTLIEHAENQFYEIFHFLKATVGTIEVSMIMKNQPAYRMDRVASVTVTPPTERRAQS